MPLAEGAELRALEPWNAAEFAEHLDRARDHFEEFLSWPGTIHDADAAQTWIQRYADKRAAGEGDAYGIWVDDVLRGGVLFPVFHPARRVCEIGVWLDPAASGRGLVTLACREMIDWAVRRRGMRRVEWFAAVDNLRSNAVAKRLGMVHEGVLRQAYRLGDVQLDVAAWSMLADDWLARD